MYKIKQFLIKIVLIISLIIILSSSIVYIFSERTRINEFILQYLPTPLAEAVTSPNPLTKSLRQIPPDNILDLEINNDAYVKGQWSAPIDWNVTAIHSILLPDSSVMTYGTFGIEEKENIDTRENKHLILTDGRELERDVGAHQWDGHDVNSGIDWDIWDVKKGHTDIAHQLFKKPVFLDAFCSIGRVIDSNRVFILGGNQNSQEGMADTQKSTLIYNVKERKFEMSKTLNFERWYGSIVRTGDNKLVMIGGRDDIGGASGKAFSTVPEILDLEKIDDGWRVLDKAKSYDLFADKDADEWSYPKSFLSSDGNIVGISYNKIWFMDKLDGYRVSKTGEIPLVTGGIANTLENLNPNSHSHTSQEQDNKLKLLTIGSPVGSTASAVMIEKDQIFIFGGDQEGNEYSPSNKVMRIDFSDSDSPKLEELRSMHTARSDGDATILPTGEVFLNGGHSYNDVSFSSLIPEIYNTKNSTTKEMSSAYFRRNYHATSLLLPNGTILTAGGDLWNAEIFYPPYLFTKTWDNKTILAERPKILDLDPNINRGNLIINTSSSENISRVTLISTGSVTHAQGSESKFTTLKFSKLKNNQLLVDMPENRNEIQNGTYLLFLINNSEVPSHGKIININ